MPWRAPLRPIIIPALASLLLFSSSCSWYRDVQRSLVEDDTGKTERKKRPVTRDQYDQLLVKYEELTKKYEALKENPNGGQPSLVDDLQNSQAQNFSNTANGLDTETVDLFQTPAVTAGKNSMAPTDLGSQLNLFRKGLTTKSNNPSEAIKIFQQLETGTEPAVAARAKFQVGELMFSKQQYDVALQVFEDIIATHAHSGAVLDALKFAVVCSEKLGLKAKKDQYSSMLNDVFESN